MLGKCGFLFIKLLKFYIWLGDWSLDYERLRKEGGTSKFELPFDTWGLAVFLLMLMLGTNER